MEAERRHLRLRCVYGYADKVIHESVFDANAALNRNYARLLNEKGHVIETVTFDTAQREKPVARDRYKYVSYEKLWSWHEAR